MSLRQRLAISTLAVALPGLVCLLSLERYLHRRTFEASITQTTLVHMLNGGRARCETAPDIWADALHAPPPGMHPPRERLYERHGRHEHGPHPDGAFGPPPAGMMPPEPPEMELRDPRGGPWEGPGRPPPNVFALNAYDAQFSSRNARAPEPAATLRNALLQGETSAFEVGDARYEALVRMPWATGPCAVIGVAGMLPMMERTWLPPLELWLPPLLIALGSVTLALGPVLRRLRRLTAAVSRAPLHLYATPIEVRGSDEISALARAFANAGAEINKHITAQEQRERTLRNFLENTTHDVSIPLTVLQGYITQIHGQAQRNMPVTPDVASAAMQEAHYIASLLHNLNVAAKLEAGEPHIQRARIDLNAVVLRAVARHAPVAAKARIELVHGVPEEQLWVHADMTLVEQAFSNIIYNAIRYNKAGGHVAATLDVHAPGQFVMTVTDDGPGIPEAQRTGITQRYARGNEARTRHPEGQGLGLSIAHRVCELHGWELSLHTSEFGGLEVRFVGPLLA